MRSRADWWPIRWVSPLVAGVVVVVTVLMIALVKAAIKEQEEWEAFRIANDCRIVEKTRAHTNTGVLVGADGKMGITSSTTPAKTGWLCNDGITYWR